MLPLKVVSGISGKPEGGERFPKWTVRLLGRLTITTDGFTWVPLAPWRRPRRVAVAWSEVQEMRFWSAGSTDVWATGWTGLRIAPDRRKRVLEAVEAAGFVLHRNPAWPGDVIATRPNTRPVWRRV